VGYRVGLKYILQAFAGLCRPLQAALRCGLSTRGELAADCCMWLAGNNNICRWLAGYT
jgi:hypothetical protein